jgi:hypothetical protein
LGAAVKRLPTSEVDVCGGQVIDAFVVSVMIVMIDECPDLRFEVCRKVVVLQQNADLILLPNIVKTIQRG